MTHSMNTHVHSSNAMRAAGFRYTHRGDTVRCDRCTLEVSRWTHDMDPFTVHSVQSPHCAFVQSSNNVHTSSYSRSLSPSDFTSEGASSNEQNPAKRQRTQSSFSEVDGLKQARRHSFSLWAHAPPFRARMVEAGFFSCNVNDRVICIYCDLICHEWNIESDDPCEVHKTLSPNCVWVKSMIIRCDNNPSSIQPSHTHYTDPQKRYASFSTWPDTKLPSIKKFVDAGFFYDNHKITCFYCNGSFEDWESGNHPIAEHVRWFPHCNHAKQLCGEELYHKIQQSMRYVSSARNGEFKENYHHGLIIPDEETLTDLVAARLDLPMSQSLLERKLFERSTIKQCWENQLRFKHDDFISECDLFSACIIHNKQIELIEKGNKKIIVPSRDLQTNGGHPSPSGNSNQSYTNILVSFENDLQRYKDTRQTLAAEFKEEKQITKDRERSLRNWSYPKPSRLDLVKGGWIVSNTGDYWKCPHCHMTYHNWTSNDDPFLIHRYLSPHCLFVLSSNPFHQNEIPIRPVNEQFTDDDIARSESQPYNGLVQSKFSFMHLVSDRLISFNRFPGGCPVNASELAIAGFFYINYGRFIRCYYCTRTMSVRNLSSQSNKYLKYYHLSGQCFYTQQLNDCDPNRSIEEGKSYKTLNILQCNLVASDKCVWCIKEKKRLVVLPCRHFCLCEKCGQTNWTCPKCSNDVTAYAILYPA